MTNQIKAKTAEQVQTELYVKTELSYALNTFKRADRLKTPGLYSTYCNLMTAFEDYYTCFGKHHPKDREYAALSTDNH